MQHWFLEEPVGITTESRIVAKVIVFQHHFHIENPLQDCLGGTTRPDGGHPVLGPRVWGRSGPGGQLVLRHRSPYCIIFGTKSMMKLPCVVNLDAFMCNREETIAPVTV